MLSEEGNKRFDLLFEALPREGTKAFEAMCEFCTVNRARVLASLPWMTAEIAGNDGFEVMINFVRRWGGQRIFISKRYDRCLAKLSVPVSEKTHARMAREAGEASLLEAPSAWGVFLVLRRVAILVALDDGASTQCLVTRFGVTERSLRTRTISD